MKMRSLYCASLRARAISIMSPHPLRLPLSLSPLFVPPSPGFPFLPFLFLFPVLPYCCFPAMFSFPFLSPLVLLTLSLPIPPPFLFPPFSLSSLLPSCPSFPSHLSPLSTSLVLKFNSPLFSSSSSLFVFLFLVLYSSSSHSSLTLVRLIFILRQFFCNILFHSFISSFFVQGH